MRKVTTHYYDFDSCDIPDGLEADTPYTVTEMKNLTFAAELKKESEKITNLLIEKNKAYGNSALNPANIFSKLNASEALCSRIDDKLMRIKNRGITDQTEDTVDDLIGYLFLLKMSMKEEKGG
jgi:hypothetical protein